jgi:hypothetical protein
MQLAVASTNLSPVQAQVVAALAQGRTITTAAAEANIHRNTIHNWLHEPQFKTAVEEAQREYAATLADGMRDLAARALETLRQLLDDPKASPAVRLRTALAILQRPHFPNPGWHMPVRIEPPQEQQLIDGLAEMEAEDRAMRMTGAIEASARRSDPPPSPAPIARSAPCPCGSGIKYKRCCGAASPGKFTPPNTAQRAAA